MADADRRDRVLQPVLEALLAAAELSPGDDVLDIGCGCGATTIAAHGELASGTALGVDISGPMLAVARSRTVGVGRIGFTQADAQTHQLESRFDVAISRFGTMFFDDPVTAHRNIRAALRPGGRLCLATWQPLEANEWLLVPGTALLAHGTMPPSDPGPGMFAQADPAEVTRVLAEAGWSDISVEPVTLSLRLGADAAEATDYLADTGIARRVLDTIEPARRAQALAEVTDVLASYDNGGVRLRAGINLIHAMS